ncbi:MAG: glutathione peroxidase [Phycisphaerales bacterium]|jgi:glutathione peroxidase
MPCCGTRLSFAVLPALLIGAAFGFGLGQPDNAQAHKPDADPADPAYVLGYEINRIDGTPTKLSEFEGKVVLIVNTASKCGLTPQYEALEKLYRDKKDEGFVILGFPANNFGAQEPGSNSEIAQFCRENYEVSFPMFEKLSVKGEDQHPLYKRLAEQPEPIGAEPEWNFAKFLVNREGQVVARFASRAKPTDEKLVGAIDRLLAEEAPEG